MNTEKVMVLESCRYDDLAKYSKVFNRAEIEYHLWIYLNPEEVRDAVFLEALEVGPNADPKRRPIRIFQRESQCWIRAVTDTLNLTPGKHTYKLKFVNRFTDTDFSLYVSYYFQEDYPKKPYVYMIPKVVEEHEEESYSGETEFTPYGDPEDAPLGFPEKPIVAPPIMPPFTKEF